MKDERLNKMNQEYHELPIPAELHQRVEAGIREAKKEQKKNKMIVFVKTAGGAAAAAVIAITVMANSGAGIAHAMAKIPIIGAIAEVVTFREYQDTTENMSANVKVCLLYTSRCV